MNSNDKLLDALTREGVLISVSVRYWRASKKLKPEDIGLNPENLDTDLISLGHKKLIPKEAMRQFALIESRAHALVEANTFPFLNGLAHFLPNTKLEETTRRLSGLEREFCEEKQRFMSRYAETRDTAMREWQSLAQRLVPEPERLVAVIEESFPCPERMEKCFGFGTQLFQLTVPEGLGLNPVTARDQQEVMDARARAAREAAENIRAGVTGFIGDCVATLRESTAKLCEEMLSSMREGKSGVHQKTLNRLVKFIEQFRDLNFAGDRKLEEELDRVKKEFLSKTAEEYRDSEYARGQLQVGLEGLAQKARELMTQDSRELVERFGQMGVRRFLVEPSGDGEAVAAESKVA